MKRVACTKVLSQGCVWFAQRDAKCPMRLERSNQVKDRRFGYRNR